MKKRLWTYAVLFVLIPSTSLASQSFSAQEMAARISSLDPEQALPALTAIPTVPSELYFFEIAPDYTVDPIVAEAIINAFAYAREQKNLEFDGLPHDNRNGLLNHEGLGEQLLFYTMALGDPSAIPALLKAAVNGSMIRNAIIDFGPQAVPHAIECAADPEGLTNAIEGCINVLTAAASLWSESMSVETKARIRAVALQNLEALSWHTDHAAELAFVIGWDQELQALVRERVKDDGYYDWQYENMRAVLEGRVLDYVSAYEKRLSRARHSVH